MTSSDAKIGFEVVDDEKNCGKCIIATQNFSTGDLVYSVPATNPKHIVHKADIHSVQVRNTIFEI